MNHLWTIQQPRSRRRRLLLAGLLTLILLSFAGAAFAQSSELFDLGCWGTFTSAGGRSTATSFTVSGVLGQTAAGQSGATSFTVRGGYAQDWRTLTPPPSVVPNDPGPERVYFPLLGSFNRIVRPCNW